MIKKKKKAMDEVKISLKSHRMPGQGPWTLFYALGTTDIF